MQADVGIEMFLVRSARGVSAATSSISMPPSLDTISTGLAAARSSTMPRYSSRAMSQPSSTKTRLTVLPSRAGLNRDELVAEQVLATSRLRRRVLTSCTPRCLRIVFDRAFAAAAGVNLGLHTAIGAAQFLERRGGFVGRGRDVAAEHGDAGFSEELLGLVFVDFHLAGR